MTYFDMQEQEKKRIAIKLLQTLKDEAPSLTVRDYFLLLRDTEHVMTNAAPMVVPEVDAARI